MLKRENFWNLIGCILGIVILLVGVVFLITPPDSYNTTSTDYATFGADYYTYQYDATRAIATNAAVTANNLREIGQAQAHYAGALFMVIGALTVVCFGKKYFTYVPDKVQPITAERSDDEFAVASEVQTDAVD